MPIHRQTMFYEGMLHFVPSPPLQEHLVKRLVRVMRRRHPDLLAAFAALDPAVVHVHPTGLRHRFALTFGGGRLDISVLAPGGGPAQAVIKGDLAVLIDLLEGRYDGDALFFAGDLQIAGDTAVIVALRNTLDREVLDMGSEVAALFHPFERPARRMGRHLSSATQRVHAGMGALYARWHEGLAAAPQHEAEVAALRTEVKALQQRLAKLSARQMRADIGLENPMGLELVCPAGTHAALYAAIEAGADTVYCGCRDATNARNYPGLNFGQKEMAEGISYARQQGRKVLVAVNTFPTAGNPAPWQRAIGHAGRRGRSRPAASHRGFPLAERVPAWPA